MKKSIESLTDAEKLCTVYQWAVFIKSFINKQETEIIKLSKTELLEKFQELIDLVK